MGHRLIPTARRMLAAALTLLVLVGVDACAMPISSPDPTWTPTPKATPRLATATTTSRPTSRPSGSPSPTRTTTPESTATDQPTPSPTIQASPAVEPTPIVTVPVGPGPEITFFRPDPQLIDPGEPVRLQWASTGANRALLYKLFYSGQLPPEGIDVPPSGSYVYQVSVQERNWVNFLLYVWDDANRSANAGATVQLRCPEVWFFAPAPEDICPTAPIIGPAAEQHFEGGTMVWVAAEDAIFVLFDSPKTTTRWTRFEDRWDESIPESDPGLVAPSGRQQPIRGFGLVWREQPRVREQLGWALDSERAYTAALQRTTRYKYNAWYLLALDGNVWYLGPERSASDKITATTLNVKLD